MSSSENMSTNLLVTFSSCERDDCSTGFAGATSEKPRTRRDILANDDTAVVDEDLHADGSRASLTGPGIGTGITILADSTSSWCPGCGGELLSTISLYWFSSVQQVVVLSDWAVAVGGISDALDSVFVLSPGLLTRLVKPDEQTSTHRSTGLTLNVNTL